MPTLDREPANTLPTVSAVVCTRDRAELLRRAVRSILVQDYPGELEVVIVSDDGSTRTAALAAYQDLVTAADELPQRSVHVEVNSRTSGLAGARNSGILAATGELIAFCDDDDEWLPGKLTAQLDAWHRHPHASIVATGITIVTGEGSRTRIPPEHTTLADLLRSRVAPLHPSSFLLSRARLLERIGLVDQEVPHSYAEDYELMLRCARIGPIIAVPRALTIVHWDRLSFFNAQWDAVAEGLSYVLGQVPEFETDRIGRARIRGQVAFAHAAAGRRTKALRWAGAAWRDDPRQLRAYGAVAVAAGLASPDHLVERVNARGKGL